MSDQPEHDEVTVDTIQANITGLRGSPVIAAPVDPEELVDNDEAAKLLRVKPQTLAAWRCHPPQGVAPLPFYKIGRRCYYRRVDIMAFIGAQRRELVAPHG